MALTFRTPGSGRATRFSALPVEIDDKLGNEPERQHLDAHDHEQHPQNERGSLADGIPVQLLERHPDEDPATNDAETDPEPTEQVKRPSSILNEELDSDEIEQASPEADDTELGRPEEPRSVVHVDLGYRESLPRGEHRDIAMQFAIEVKVSCDLGGHHLESAVEVAALDTRHDARDRVVDPRRVALDESIVSSRTPTSDQVERAIQGIEESGNLARVVLTIGIHDDHDVALGLGEADAERR
jgi:hypothetical protein